MRPSHPFFSSGYAEDSPGDAAQSYISQYQSTKSIRDNRVTLLGITKGVAFLNQQDFDPVKGREHGGNAVPWLRVSALVEAIGDAKIEGEALHQYHLKVVTDDGGNLIKPINVRVDGRSFVSRSYESAPMALDYKPLASGIFPTVPPAVEKPENAVVVVFTYSGDIRASETAELRFGIGVKDRHLEVVFDNVPMP
ncbi:hypothetical protein [Candidatus Laterigemmans baculatus]|uniref:hypothetical protein n=1 Tax=Candidatus Laterigemmans baculatus TaxID=2770505 RepID=UPI0013D9E442|nr:hypothetical protein [Candidatus Laterigemmans baculatus]